MISVRAPGKLMLAGEYGVALADGPAIAVGVGAHAVVTVWSDESVSGWRLSSPALGLVDASPTHSTVVAAAIEASGTNQQGHIRVESFLGVGENKPGLGASAAICAATFTALRVLGGQERPDVDEAIEAHRVAQGGRGSGYDVATSLLGGVCAFQQTGEGSRVQELSWPEALLAAPLYVGQSAQTPHLLGAFAAADGRDDHLEGMVASAQGFIDSWKADDVPGVISAARRCEEVLREASDALGLGLMGPGYERLRLAVEGMGVTVRTSGAGGGDCVWLLADDPARLDAATVAATEAGASILDVSYPARGTKVLREKQIEQKRRG